MKSLTRCRSIVVFVSVCAVFLVSCSLRPVIILYNNTDQRITVTVEDYSTKIAPRKRRRVGLPSLGGDFVIEDSGHSWRYTIAGYPPGDYTGSSAHVRIKAQLEPDGKIYITVRSADLPLTSLPPQPDGFPLTPQ